MYFHEPERHELPRHRHEKVERRKTVWRVYRMVYVAEGPCQLRRVWIHVRAVRGLDWWQDSRTSCCRICELSSRET